MPLTVALQVIFFLPSKTCFSWPPYFHTSRAHGGKVKFMIHVRFNELSAGLPLFSLDHSGWYFGSSISGRSFSDTNLFFDHSSRQSWYSIAFWTIATIFLNQQSIISTIAIDNLNHQSIISITAIDIFNHRSINLTIAIDFLIISRELIPLLTDMASHKINSSKVVYSRDCD